jgi:hypothetical protein
MLKVQNLIRRKGLFSGLLRLTLVIALIAFSGTVSVASSKTETTKTEIQITNRVSVKKTLSYKTVVKKLVFSISHSGSFRPCLLQYERATRIKFKSNCKPTVAFNKSNRHFQRVYSASNAEEFSPNQLRG